MDKDAKRKKAQGHRVYALKKLDFDENSQDIHLFKDLPVISRNNIKKLQIINNAQYKVVSFNKEVVRLNRIYSKTEQELEIPITKFMYIFYPAYCTSTHRSQGLTINEPFTIHEYERMDKHLRYTALSRSTEFKLVNIIKENF